VNERGHYLIILRPELLAGSVHDLQALRSTSFESMTFPVIINKIEFFLAFIVLVRCNLKDQETISTSFDYETQILKNPSFRFTSVAKPISHWPSVQPKKS